jgi:hypothetical protein
MKHINEGLDRPYVTYHGPTQAHPLNHKLLRRAQDNMNAIPSFRWMKFGILKTAFMWIYENNHPLSQACQMRLTKTDLTSTFSDHS